MTSEEEATACIAGAAPSQPVDVPITTAETTPIDEITPVDRLSLPLIAPVSSRPTRVGVWVIWLLLA